MMRRFIVYSSLLILILGFAFNCFAEEIAILYTGDTHAMLYPCSCPKEPDGGIARRLTLIKELRKKYPHALLLDSGNFFGAGTLDEYTQNTQLDKERTLINLRAMEMMQYDAVVLGDSEFNFGKDFLQENIEKSKLNFLSCNLSAKKALPYIIKEVGGIRVGIIGVTSQQVAQKAEGLEIDTPAPAVAEVVAELKKNKADVIVLLSHLGERQDQNLINGISGIDVIISGSNVKEAPFTKIGNTLVVRPSWQGRSLGQVVLTFRDKKIIDHKVEQIRLSDELLDDKGIQAILPRCFCDANCKKEGQIGRCENLGTLNAKCKFSEPARVNLTVIVSKDCTVCQPELFVDFLKKQFPGLKASYLNNGDSKAKKLIQEFAIWALPAYILGNEVEGEKNFDTFKANLKAQGGLYLVKPEFSGFSYLLNRKSIKGKLDLFISLYGKDADKTLEVMQEFNPEVHFLAKEEGGKFDAASGNLEVEEYLRALCVRKYYTQNFWKYLICRAKNIASSWWENCAMETDMNKIKACAQGDEGAALLKENIGMNKELQVMFGPAYLKDNKEVFGTQEVPGKEEFKTIIKR